MGTETTFGVRTKCEGVTTCVKLNNPLMGTETSYERGVYMEYTYKQVKLNNPLMGTETQLLHIVDYH